MDRKMFDFNEYNNYADKDNGTLGTKPQICFDTNFCNPTKSQNTQDILTMAFVNTQPLDYVYDELKAYENGSLFPNITKPFYYGEK